MSRLLVHIATGPENPTRVALGLLVARSALDAGHDVDLFIAGDGVAVLRPETLDVANGIGTGSLREHVDALAAGGARFFASGLSSKARGLTAGRPRRARGHDGAADPPRRAGLRGGPGPHLLTRRGCDARATFRPNLRRPC